MIPFSLKVVIFKIWQFLLKISTPLLFFRTPRLFTGPGSSLKLCEHIAGTGVKKLLIVTDAMLVKIGLLKAMQEKLAALGVTYVTPRAARPEEHTSELQSPYVISHAV